MRKMLTGVVVLVLGVGIAAPAQAGHPFSFLKRGDDACAEPHRAHSLFSFLHKKDECSEGHRLHKLWPFGGHKLHGHGGHQCQFHPWFHTFKAPLGPESAFPHHPFVRSPRDFFMYER